MTKLLVISDEESNYIWDYFDPNRFKDVDIIISCGDLKSEYLSFLVSMINAPLLYVHGNHDTKYQTSPPEGCECIEDKLVLYKGLRIMGLGGSYRYSPGDHQYSERQMRRRISKLRYKLWRNKGVDIVVTHAPVYKIGDGEDLCHRGFECFVELINKYEPRYLFHGHQHLNYGRNVRIHNLNDTQIINAFGYYLIEI
ncbi:serine/threonine protein phosphatase [Paenibacillus sp. CCS19]|uniref:metallophosphoesterase family protein n=1 Tax=Paenibacillus sp. CCS19 TaxID=3158387 RepID=UPI0025625254|nr:metallophosphoesterase [Paenibacillus cellulosilyticus]GMK38080.1 serine/threonine protein phosphatase [Paenibacillus cellulosilyticus]